MKGNKHLQCLLVESAWGATRVKDGYLKRKYQGLIPRRGKKKALVAVGHKIIVAAYHILEKNEKYKEPDLNPKTEKAKIKSIRNYMNKIEALKVSREDLIKIFESETIKTTSRFFTEQKARS